MGRERIGGIMIDRFECMHDIDGGLPDQSEMICHPEGRYVLYEDHVLAMQHTRPIGETNVE